jgi:hypothetical protein
MTGYVIAFVILVICIAVPLAAYYFTQMRDKPPPGPSPGPSSEGSQLTITENGTTLTEGYRIMPKSEAYIQMPDVSSCGRDNEKSYCSSYEGITTNGFAYVYDLSLSDITSPDYTECPGGGHDCWFIEKYDSEGNMIGVVNKNGESMLDKLVDDIWDDKLNMDSAMVSELLSRMEFKNGKLVTILDFSMPGDITFAVGDEFKITDSPIPSLYFLILFLAMKLAGEEKPGKIVINVKNAKEKFDAFERQ